MKPGAFFKFFPELIFRNCSVMPASARAFHNEGSKRMENRQVDSFQRRAGGSSGQCGECRYAGGDE